LSNRNRSTRKETPPTSHEGRLSYQEDKNAQLLLVTATPLTRHLQSANNSATPSPEGHSRRAISAILTCHISQLQGKQEISRMMAGEGFAIEANAWPEQCRLSVPTEQGES
jgi:hypothetical protein